MELDIWFDHGLGDCANFVHVMEMYRRRGYTFNLHYAKDKETIFQAVGAQYIPVDTEGIRHVPFPEPPLDPNPAIADQYWLYNKTAMSVSQAPMPDIGTPEQLWPELCSVRLDLTPHIAGEKHHFVRNYLRDLPKPVVLLHSMGNNYGDLKNIPPPTLIALYRALLDRMDGTLILLDWDNRVPRLANWRVRHLTDDWVWIDIPTFVALMQQADLLISVDSGPYHLARLTNIPVVGVFPSLNKHPGRVALPRGRTVNVVPRDITHNCNLQTRTLFNIIETCGGHMEVDAAYVAEAAVRMLQGPRYLPAEHLGADVQLQQYVLDWERGHANSLTQFNDRHRSFDLLFREMRQRFDRPLVVETGCIRAAEDWQGSGYSTYLFGAFLDRFGGELLSVDISEENCAFARNQTREMGCVSVVTDDSVRFLRELRRPIDVLLIDSLDTWDPDHEEHALQEIQAAYPLLREWSLVLFDDTVYRHRRFTGKGATAVPWLLERGWRILYSGYQTLCSL